MSDSSTTTPPDTDTETESSTCVDSSSSEESYETAEEDIPLFPIPPDHPDFSPIRFPKSIDDFVDRLDLQTDPAWEQRYDAFVEQNTLNHPPGNQETPSRMIVGVGIQATPVTTEVSVQTDLTAERTTEDLKWLGEELPADFWDPYVKTPETTTPSQTYAEVRAPSPSCDDFRSPDCN